jgi:N-acetyl-anhydromuramyl-L-alanine amidase AmpD
MPLWPVVAGGVAVVFLLLIAIPSLHSRMEPRGIVIHHTGWIGAPITAASLDQFHARNGYKLFYWGRTYHVGYHYVIYPDGHVESGRPEHAMGAHTKDHNDYLGIALVGNFSPKHNPRGQSGLTEPTPEQLHALLDLTARLRKKYDIPEERVIVHRQVHATECPGDRFPTRVFYRLMASMPPAKR